MNHFHKDREFIDPLEMPASVRCIHENSFFTTHHVIGHAPPVAVEQGIRI
jgi:hypothetical protein